MDRGSEAPGQVQTPQVRRHGLLPAEFVDIMAPPMKVGVWTGALGAFTGVAVGIGQGQSLAQAGFMNGVHWFTLGSTFWFTRSMLIRTRGSAAELTPAEKTMASSFSGMTAGALAGLLRGPRSIVPSTVTWAVAATGGQLGVNYWVGRPARPANKDDSWLRSKWSPLKKLTDEEYVSMMEEKMLRVETEIALIDDRIAALRETQRASEEEERNGRRGGSSP